jgi:hypothetical protein
MTYRIDSDIGLYYGNVFEIASGKRISPNLNPKWMQPDANFYGEDQLLKLIENGIYSTFVLKMNTFIKLLRTKQKWRLGS